ncbi:hypothetical protein QQS21_009050 [Conoideocrella luteorostrata]|uniref:Uncharacterized protein n=1 Tax=Conoideocrella luteorostrata TaxID=1105319 RepID=A0AAJ0CHQ9_9HYPO|nr:hypothetical protein QQS21_009050 [Conoideocrella luteorostrata]
MAFEVRRDARRIYNDKFMPRAECPTLRGWELCDIAAFKGSWEKKVNVGPASDLLSTDGKWYDIPKKNPEIMVLFYKGLAPPIEPKDASRACKSWTPLPQGHLLATVSCLRQLSESLGGTIDKPRLTKKLFWGKPAKGKVFESCNERQDEGCKRVQLLVKGVPDTSLPDIPRGALIFGRERSYKIERCPSAGKIRLYMPTKPAEAEDESVCENTSGGDHLDDCIFHAQEDSIASNPEDHSSNDDAADETDLPVWPPSWTLPGLDNAVPTQSGNTDPSIQKSSAGSTRQDAPTDQPRLRRVKGGILHVEESELTRVLDGDK